MGFGVNRGLAYDTLRGETLLFGGMTADSVATKGLWRWHSGYDQRPGHVLRVPLDVAGISADTVQSVKLHWQAGGDSIQEETPKAGVELLAYSGGTWTYLTQNNAPSDAPAQLTFESSDVLALLYGSRPYLSFVVRPVGFNGKDYATISSDYEELTLEYRLPSE
jgi:hypothetical protein